MATVQVDVKLDTTCGTKKLLFKEDKANHARQPLGKRIVGCCDHQQS